MDDYFATAADTMIDIVCDVNFNIVDSSYCTCGDIEDTHHFLFVCHQFTDLRRDLINSVSDICQPNLNVLLCGDISLTFDQNKQIFEAVQYL